MPALSLPTKREGKLGGRGWTLTSGLSLRRGVLYTSELHDLKMVPDIGIKPMASRFVDVRSIQTELIGFKL